MPPVVNATNETRKLFNTLKLERKQIRNSKKGRKTCVRYAAVLLCPHAINCISSAARKSLMVRLIRGWLKARIIICVRFWCRTIPPCERFSWHIPHGYRCILT